MLDISIVDLDIILRYSLAIGQETAPADEVLAALDASRAFVIARLEEAGYEVVDDDDAGEGEEEEAVDDGPPEVQAPLAAHSELDPDEAEDAQAWGAFVAGDPVGGQEVEAPTKRRRGARPTAPPPPESSPVPATTDPVEVPPMSREEASRRRAARRARRGDGPE